MLGVPYEGADFRFDPPRFDPIRTPSVAVIGTGKRVGKTAVTGHVARAFARQRSVVVVAMGRGGPAEPELVEVRPTVSDLLALSRAGRHAASDHLETAALTGLQTVGCRRCGGGLAGAVGTSNVLAGVRLAEGLDPDLIVLDGSGAAIPPIAADRRILVVGAHQETAVAAGYLNPYRALLADLVVITMAEDGLAHGALAEAFQELVRPSVPIVRVVLRPRPLGDVRGRRIAYFGTAPAARHDLIASHLAAAYGADVAHVSGRLGDREALRTELAGLDAELLVVEVKAAAIDVVAEEAARLGIPVLLAANDIVPLADEPSLDVELERLATEAISAAAIERMSERRYLAPLPLGGDEGPPWSKGLMARALAATGLDPTRAYELARRADADMVQRGALELDLDRLAEITAEVLEEPESGRTMRRLRRLQALQHLELPVVLLVGGATGTGKSTLATEAAHRLGITRVTSTDFIRQTMRAFFSREFMPSVHYSSFDAELALSRADEDLSGDAGLLGFLDQTRNVLVGVEAAIDRSLTEGWSMVLEGVHIVPGMIAVDRADALVVQCLVAISDEHAHRSHFWVRDASTEGLRPLEKYLEGMPEIRMIQDVLLERARRFDVPVIENTSLDEAIGQVLDLVLTGAERLARV